MITKRRLLLPQASRRPLQRLPGEYLVSCPVADFSESELMRARIKMKPDIRYSGLYPAVAIILPAIIGAITKARFMKVSSAPMTRPLCRAFEEASMKVSLTAGATWGKAIKRISAPSDQGIPNHGTPQADKAEANRSVGRIVEGLALRRKMGKRASRAIAARLDRL